MNSQHVIGIDISKKTFDLEDHKGIHHVFSQDLSGFKKLHKLLPKGAICVMEATGIYHQQLAQFLHSKSIKVAVINPLTVKRFIQMHLKRIKTDKSDVSMIRKYGQTQNYELWKPIDSELAESKDAYQTMEQYIKVRASLKNKLEELNCKKAAVYLIQSLENQIISLSKSIEELEAKVIELVNTNHSQLLTNISSIAGIGQRTASLLVISTDGFRHFSSAKQLASYYGLAPSDRTSGTSLRGASKISKMGNPLVRKKLYMCSLTAIKYNPACQALYKRLLAKEKPKKLALVAVANKLLKIVYAIAKSNIPFDPKYRSYRKVAV